MDLSCNSELLNLILNNLPSTAVLIVNRNLEILFCNKLLHQQSHTSDNVKNLDEILNFQGFDMQSLFDSSETLFMQMTVKPDCRPYNFRLIPFEEFVVFIGELVGVNENDILSMMSRNTNDIANLSRELRSKNRELEAANARISQLVRVDTLTGLFNRRVLYEAYETHSNLGLRHQVPFSLIMSDIDNFKSVNDTYGHGTGDTVLREFSEIILKNTRSEDVAVRYGGEEFVILLPHTAVHDAEILAHKIRGRLENCDILKDRVITASFGVSQWNAADSLDTMINRADEALYEAKRTGRNRVIVK